MWLIISEKLLFLQKAKKVYDESKEEYKKRTGKEVENFFAL